MKDLPGLRIEPASPALAGGFFTTEPPGKPLIETFQGSPLPSRSSLKTWSWWVSYGLAWTSPSSSTCLFPTASLSSRLQAPLPKIQPLYPSAKSNLRDRVLGGIEKGSFITLPDEGGHTGILPLKTMCPNLGEFNDGFITCGSQVRSLTRLEYE